MLLSSWTAKGKMRRTWSKGKVKGFRACITAYKDSSHRRTVGASLRGPRVCNLKKKRRTTDVKRLGHYLNQQKKDSVKFGLDGLVQECMAAQRDAKFPVRVRA